MISLKQSVDEYETLTRSLAASTRALRDTLVATGQYAVETDVGAVREFRERVAAIRDSLKSGGGKSCDRDFEAVSTQMRAALNEYQNRATAYIQRLKKDLDTTSEALTDLLSTLQDDSSDAERLLRSEIENLVTIETVTTLESAQATARQSTERLNDCLERLALERETIVALLKNEIRTLQAALEQATRTETLDPVTGLHHKDEFVKLLRRKVVAGLEIGIAHVWIRNFGRMVAPHPEKVRNAILAAFAARLRDLTSTESTSGHWSNDSFCVLTSKASLPAICDELGRGCPGRYTCTVGGETVTVQLQAVVARLIPRPGEDADIVVSKLERMQYEL